jgi:uncharacterized protein (DUF433 family)
MVHMEDRVVIDPRVCHGKPVIRGTRVPVSIIVGSLASGMTVGEIEREYAVTAQDIGSALEFTHSFGKRALIRRWL